MKNKKVCYKLIDTQVLAVAALVVFIVLGVWLIYGYITKEKNRDLMAWQSQLAIMAETRVSDIESLLRKRKVQVQGLANNTSLRLFLTQYENKSLIEEPIVSAQKGYVRNLIISSADRLGLNSNGSDGNNFNINIKSEYGLVVLDSKQQIMMSTKYFTRNIEEHEKIIESVYKTLKPQFVELYRAENKDIVYGYIAPVLPVQNSKLRAPVGAVMVLLNPRLDLFKLLESRQRVTLTDEAMLVKSSDSAVVYLSPLKGGFNIFHQQADENNLLAATHALNNSGGFAEKKDYSGEDVLVIGRKIKGSLWVLVQKISVNEALAESNNHRQYLLMIFILVLLFVSVAFVAVWKHGVNKRLKELSGELEARTALLDAVTENIKDNIILLDEKSKIIFINSALSNDLQVMPDEVKSMPASTVLGSQTIDQLESGFNSIEKAFSMSVCLNNVERELHVTKSSPGSGVYKNAKLFVMHDIGELKQEQEKREQLAKGIISTLVKAVDLHDPYCANHSQRTREVAVEIGKEMSLDKSRLDTLEMAALLANIGKLFVPKEILIKHGKLSEDEKKQLKQHIEHTVNILSELSFNGPVVDIISQKNERLDGSGYPGGLSADGIMKESRVLAVANAFVAMTSSRAYREGRKVNEVIDLLLEQANEEESKSQYDRHVVAALFHIAENKTDWKSWYTIDSV